MKSETKESFALGSQGLRMARIGLGCMGLTSFYGRDTERADAAVVVRHALNLGIQMLDTADAYGPSVNEIAIGQAMRGNRPEFLLATKFGVVRESNDRNAATGSVCGRPEYVRRSCEESLRRLQTDWIDLYYMHRHDPNTPIEDTVGALSDLVRSGKIRHIGFCEIGPNLIKRAHSVHPLTAVQSEYSLWHRDTERVSRR